MMGRHRHDSIGLGLGLDTNVSVVFLMKKRAMLHKENSRHILCDPYVRGSKRVYKPAAM
jgi:hypothetical protein